MLDLASEEAALGGWPRRLLHVSSLTSYEWQPGNRYGNATEPEYNAITYTWGRWKLKNEAPREKPEVTALPITGTAWPIPRVDPAHFTVQQLQQTISKVAELEIRGVGQWTRPVEFVWLDVACIDQRGNEPRSRAEIGRQAIIFRRAHCVCVWLARLNMESLEKGLVAFSTFGEQNIAGAMEDDIAIRHVQRFLSDPWFSSLWTLQEAFLRPDAFILDRNGGLLEYPVSIMRGAPQVLDLFDYGKQWCALCIDKEPDETVAGIYSGVRRLIENCGLKALASINAMSTYEAAMKRTTTRPEDRVYGIQQIFEFRLGNTAVDAELGRQFTLAELEDDLGVALMKKYPLISQYHIFTEPVPREKRWRMNAYSVVPVVTWQGHSVWESSEEISGDPPFCSFSIEPTPTHPRPIRWHGSITRLNSLIKACDTIAEEVLFGELIANQNILLLLLDNAQELEGLPVYQQSTFRIVPKGSRQTQRLDWLIDRMGQSNLQILLLGPSSGSTYSYMIGILLLRCENGEWARLGICQWETSGLSVSDMRSSQFDFLSGQGPGWRRSEGIYGYV